MSDRPSPLPKGGATLSERIAALQRKTSNPTSSRSAGLSPHSGSSSSGRLSPGDSPSRPNTGSSAVRDRIARFQNDDKPLVPRSSFGAPTPNPEMGISGRRQYLGVSSGKGTGAWGENVLRPQLTGGTWLAPGSPGSWGDSSSIRPQMTGTGYLNGSRRQASLGLPGQMPRGASPDGIRGSGKNAFDELDEESAVPAVRGLRSSSLDVSPSGVTSASSGLPDLPDAPRTEVNPSAVAAARAEGGDSDAIDTKPPAEIPQFPAPPSSVPRTPVKASGWQANSNGVTSPGSVEIGIHGASPQDVEALRRKAEQMELVSDFPLGRGDSDRAHNASTTGPEGKIPKVSDLSEAVREEVLADGARGGLVESSGNPPVATAVAGSRQVSVPLVPADPNQAGDLPIRAQVLRTDSGKVDPSDPAAHLVRGPGLLVPRDEVAEAEEVGQDAVRARLSASSKRSGGVLSYKTSRPEEEETPDPAGDPSLDTTLKEEASVEDTSEGRYSDTGSSSQKHGDRNHQREDSVGTALGSDTEVAFPIPPTKTRFPLHRNGSGQSSLTSNSGTLTTSDSVATVQDVSGQTLTPSSSASRGETTVKIVEPTDGSSTPFAESKLPLNANQSSAEKARQAVALARNKSQNSSSSQRLKRPPPGTMLSAADLDASDDEYEPGWASVISSSRS
ncbi:hypothetical protein IE53DRAFT_60300 [Violaceomyces palustris]|uniref:Uncharacterized protein n=1 Tax=Violaceomyces palustris TaxID=1673888 RepID=A0ACD0P784_9BASI|nr:hypothetical protein IE53DRAFT_60300 [Violaceomyces palustris]